eukprot:Awhi_evm3s1182
MNGINALTNGSLCLTQLQAPVEALMKTELDYDSFLRSKGVDVDKIKRSQADVYNKNLKKASRISVGDLVYYQSNKDKKAGLKIKWQ